MPTIEQYKKAGGKAHAKGDREAAQYFASKIKELRSETSDSTFTQRSDNLREDQTGVVSVGDAPFYRKVTSEEAAGIEAKQVAEELMQLKKKDPTSFEQLYGAVRREVEPAAAATLAGAGIGSLAGGVGAGPGALAGLTAYGLSRAAGAFAPVVGLDDPYEKLEQFYTDMGVPEPKDEAFKTLRVLFQSAATGPVGIARGSGKQLAQTAARGAAVGVSEAAAFETAAEVAEYLDVDVAALPVGILAAMYTGVKLSPKQVDEIVKSTGAKLPKPKDLTLEETAKLATKATDNKKAKRQLAAQFAPDQDVLKAAEELDIDQFLDPDLVAVNRAATETGQAVRSYAAGPARTAQFENLEQIGNKGQQLLEEFGATQDLAGLSNRIKANIRKTINDFEKEVDDIYKVIGQSVPEGTTGTAKRTLNFIDERIRKLGGEENLSALEKQALKKLRDRGNPTYDLIDDFRKEIGEKLKNPQEFREARKAIAQKMYDTLTDDQGDVLSNLDGNLKKLWESGKAAVVSRKDFEDDMAKLFGKKLDESVFFKLGKETSALTKRDAEKFTDLLKAIPEEFRQETLMSAMDTTFAKHASSGNLNFASFSKWYDLLKSNKTAHSVFMDTLDPEAAKAIDNLAKVSGSISRATGKKIQTGRLNDFTKQVQQADNLWANLADRAKRFAMVAPIEMATQKIGMPGAGFGAALAASLMGGKKDKAIDALNKLLIDPEFVMQTRELVKTAPSINKRILNAMANNEAFGRYARIVNLSTQEERLQFLEDAINANQEEN